MRYLIALALAAIVAVSLPTTANAATCTPDAFRQEDMAGAYESSTMRLVVYPCGGVSLAWLNAYGTHSAGYRGFGRLVGNGVMARGIVPDGAPGLYMDMSPYLGIKPAERGYIELVTYGPSVDPFNMPVFAVYRLQKMPY